MIKLCKLGDLPAHLQFNKYILTGYRPPLHFMDCLKSVLYLHNETFNIFSHCATLIYFLSRIGDYTSSWDSGNHLVQLFVVFDLLTCTIPFALSVLYHTFMPHNSGVYTYRLLLKADIFGVWFATTFGSLSSMYVSLYCLPTSVHVYLVGYLLLSLVVLYYLVVADSKGGRIAALAIQFCFRTLILLLRLTSLATVDVTALYYYLLMNGVSIVGGFINTLHIPERWFPGKCDYFLNGHSLMHVAAFLSVAIGRCGLLIDLEWLAAGPSCLA